MRIIVRSAFAVMTATTLFLPLQQSEAAKIKGSSADTVRPITGSYTKQHCAQDGGRVDRKSGNIVCVLPAPAAAAVVKSKSNITNN